MRFINLLIALVMTMTIASVGLQLYVVEDEMNEIRQGRAYNKELMEANLTAREAVQFAQGTQYIAVMAEERATELGYKLEVAASIVATLEEQLENATATVERQAEEIQDLIDQNSELQNDYQWMSEEKLRLESQLETTKAELEAALNSLSEATVELDEKTKKLEEAEATIDLLMGIIPLPDPDDDKINPVEPVDITPDEIDNPLDLDESEVELPDPNDGNQEPTLAPPYRLQNPFLEVPIEVEVS